MILGIDIGTHWARAAYLDANRQPRLLELRDGSSALPALARQSLMGLEVGAEAARAVAGNGEVTVRGCTRLLGRAGDLPQRVLDRLPYSVRIEGGEAVCNLLYAEVRAAEVYGRLARVLVDDAQEQLGQWVDGVVLTVPAAADDRYRIQARAAVEAQGIQVRRLINQPTAALLAAQLPKKAKTVAIVYCGDGSTEVTLARCESGKGQGRKVAILATAGDLWLGREEMIWSVSDQLNERFRQQAGINVYGVSDGPTAALGLRHAAAEAIQNLRHALKTTVVIDHGGGFAQDLVTYLHRTEVEAWLKPDFERIRGLCRRVLVQAGVMASDVDTIVLVGDGTEVPALRETIAECFGRPVAEVLATDAALLPALGAALAQIGGLAWDVTPYALGISCVYGSRELFSPIIRPNTAVPTAAVGQREAHTQSYQTLHCDQREVSLSVLQYRGEQNPDPYGATPVTPNECEQLGMWTFGGLKPKRGERAHFTVTFAVDEDGILHLLAKEKASGHKLAIEVEQRIG
jgi:molecular chaperone DnaK (HSP70)